MIFEKDEVVLEIPAEVWVLNIKQPAEGWVLPGVILRYTLKEYLQVVVDLAAGEFTSPWTGPISAFHSTFSESIYLECSPLPLEWRPLELLCVHVTRVVIRALRAVKSRS